MSKPVFIRLARSLAPHMEKGHTNVGNTVESHKRVAVGLYHYAHGGTYVQTGEKFGISGPLAHQIVEDFIQAVIHVHGGCIHLPTAGPELHRIMKGFESLRQMPNCFGAVDCSHFLITAPNVASRRAYYDRSGKMSVIMQAVVDSQGHFLDIVAGYPGSTNDKRVFGLSALGDALAKQEIMQEPVVQIDGVNMKPYLVGDAGYTLQPYCMIPYPGQHLVKDKEWFNFWQSSTRIVVEQAFGRLKGRFRWLNGVLHVSDPEKHADIITAGCVLHNYLMQQGDAYDLNWVGGVHLRCGNQIVATSTGNELA